MLINKIFHLRESLPEARERLRELGNWDAADQGMEVHCTLNDAAKTGHFQFTPGAGNEVTADLEKVPGGDDPNRIMFRSVRGNLELAGLVEFYPIRPNLTEVVLTLDYEPILALQRVFDAVDQFINRQLARLETCVAAGRV